MTSYRLRSISSVAQVLVGSSGIEQPTNRDAKPVVRGDRVQRARITRLINGIAIDTILQSQPPC